VAGKIVVVGSCNADLLAKVDRLPRSGETVSDGEFATAPGGKGANQAVAAARAGGAVAIVARVGADAFGRESRRRLRGEGIDVRHLSCDPDRPSGVALIVIDRRGENAIAVAPGANAALGARHVAAARQRLTHADVVLLQLETSLDAVSEAAALAAQAGVRVILNPAPARPLDEQLLHRVAILTPNAREAALLTGRPVNTARDAERAARSLRKRGPQAVVVTLGARGAFACGAGWCDLIAGFPVRNAVDATGAGDAFNGALAVALAEGRSLGEAVRFANAAGALSTMRLGAQTSAPTRRAIEALLA